MTREIALKTLWDSCIHNEETKEAYKVLKERPQGEWIRKYNGHRADICCTNCGYDEGYSCFKYCPNCGADMRGGATNDL